MAIVMKHTTGKFGRDFAGDLCNRVAHDRLRVIITDNNQPVLALVPIHHRELLKEYSDKLSLKIEIDDASCVDSKEHFNALCDEIIREKLLCIICLKEFACMAVVHLKGGCDLKMLFSAIDTDDILDQMAKDALHQTECITSAEFQESLKYIGTRPYAETAESLRAFSNDSVQRLVASGVKSPHEYIQLTSGKKMQ